MKAKLRLLEIKKDLNIVAPGDAARKVSAS